MRQSRDRRGVSCHQNDTPQGRRIVKLRRMGDAKKKRLRKKDKLRRKRAVDGSGHHEREQAKTGKKQK
jgi:hypothetical protein